MLQNSAQEYGSVTKLLHWLMAVLIVALLILGIYMHELGRDDPMRRELYSLHKSLGVVALLLIIIRLAWLRYSPAPALPSIFTVKETRLVSVVKTVLYVLMLLMPISGYLMSVSGGHPVSFFGLFDLPTIMGENESMHEFTEEAHEIIGNLIILAVLLHVASVIRHRIKDRNGESDILKRML